MRVESLQVVLDRKLLVPVSGGDGVCSCFFFFVLAELMSCLLSQEARRLLLAINARLKLRLDSYDIALTMIAMS